jgi:glycosyltransferase involved in cell wall biosynthesis
MLMAHPYVRPVGGGNAVAAWAIEALREDFQITLATFSAIDYRAVNQSFGTSLREGDVDVRVAPRRYLALLRSLPTPGALMEQCVTIRWARDLDSRERFDLLLSTQNEVDFGRRGLQYVHFPWAYLPRPDIELRWFHRIPGVLGAYRGFCRSLSRGTNEGLRRNLSLANSEFVAGKIKAVHGVDSAILYPPVPGDFPDIPWERRRPAAVAVGRMHGTKRWEMAVEIVDLVRREGLDLGLTLIAHRDDLEYGQRIAALAARRPWFRILSDLSREQLAGEVAQHRYGLHTMEYEHFGIAVAELLRAGCIPFVHDSGGPVEIVGGCEELRFRDAASGAQAVAAAMRDPARQESLRRFLAARRNLFSAEEFCGSLRRLAGEFCESSPTAPAHPNPARCR